MVFGWYHVICSRLLGCLGSRDISPMPRDKTRDVCRLAVLVDTQCLVYESNPLSMINITQTAWTASNYSSKSVLMTPAKKKRKDKSLSRDMGTKSRDMPRDNHYS